MDPVLVCPLCQCTLSETEEATAEAEPAYPYVDRQRKRIRRALNIYVFAAVAAWIILLVTNVYLHNSLWWTFLIGAGMLYGYVTLWYTVQKSASVKGKVTLQALLAFLLLLLLDILLGFGGWSLNIVFPLFIVGYDFAVLIMMLADRYNWQSFILMEVLAVALSLVPFGLYALGLFTMIYLAVGVLIFTLIVFGGTIVVGGQRAREELARRFHM